MKNLLLIFVFFLSFSTFAQQSSIEISPNSNASSNTIDNTDSLTVQWSFPCMAFVGEYGVNTNGTDIYVTQWLGDSIARYDEYGTVHDEFVIPEVANTRDLAFDGQYYYGSPHMHYFYELDMVNKVLVDSVHTSFRIRGMTYNPDEDVFWCTESWAPSFHKIDRQGNTLESFIPSGITMNSISGLAYDNHSIGGPFLWGFSQDSTGAVIVKYDIANQSQTGNMIDVYGINGSYSIAGGLFIQQMPLKNTFTLGGMMQNSLVFALTLDYANTLVSIESHEVLPEINYYPNPTKDVLNISINTTNHQVFKGRLLNQTGQLIREFEASVNGSKNITINTQELDAGVYFVQLISNKGLTLTKKLMKVK